MKRLQELLRPQEYNELVNRYGEYELDWDKVFDFAWNLNVENIKYPSSYRFKAIITEIENGSFIKRVNKPRQEIIYLSKLWNDLREKGVRVLDRSQIFITDLEQALVDNGTDKSELFEINHKIADYLKENDTTERFYELLKLSQLVRNSGLVIEDIEAQAEQNYQEWEKINEYFKGEEDER